MVTGTTNEVVNYLLEGKSAAPMAAMDKMLDMVGDLSERMNRMKVFQKEQARSKKNRSPKSIFGPVLKVGAIIKPSGFGAYLSL